jgi:hypothetical protein
MISVFGRERTAGELAAVDSSLGMAANSNFRSTVSASSVDKIARGSSAARHLFSGDAICASQPLIC